MANSKLSDQDVKAICKAYEGGASSTELAGDYGVSTNTILNTLRREGVTVRPRGKRPAVVA